MMKTMSITSARKKIFDLADQISKEKDYVALTSRGKPKVVLMAVEEFESWLETLKAVNQFPNLDKDIEQATENIEKKNYKKLEKVLSEQGFVLADGDEK